MGETVADLRLLNSLAKEVLLEFQHAHQVVPSPLSPRPQSNGSLPPRIGSKSTLMAPYFRIRMKQV